MINPHLYPEPEEPEPLPPEHEVEDERQDTDESTFGVGDDRQAAPRGTA